MRTLLMLVFVKFTNSAIKQLFHEPRPYWLHTEQLLSEESTYGFPSGHASDSLAIGGYLAYRFKRSWLTWTVAVVALLVGVSRLYLGVHFIHDVIGGWLLGAAVLWVFVRYEDRAAAWLRGRSLAANATATFAASLLLIAMAELVRATLVGIADPAEWNTFSQLSRSADYAFSLGGVLFGGLGGYFLMKARARFNAAGSTGQKLLRYVVGLVGVLAIYFGLDILFSSLAADESTVGYVLRYIRYAGVGFWVTFAAPWLFLKLGLAKRAAVRKASKARKRR
jgi:hypothetical protein